MSDRPLLTFDLDGVLCRPLLGINPGTGKHKQRGAAGKKSLLWATESWRYRMRRPMPDAVEGFKQLQQTFDCKVVTARGPAAEKLTRAWFERFFGEVPELHLRPDWHETPAQYKARKMAELRPIAHFEDDPFTAAWLAELIPTVFLVDWRRNRWLAAPNIHRITRLADSESWLQQIQSSPSPATQESGEGVGG